MALIITQVGLDKATNADLQGISLKVTHVGVGLNGYVPDNRQTELQNEVSRLALQGGKKISPNQIHMTALFDGEAEIVGREVGFYLEDGTLFAVDSDPNIIIMYKSGSKGSRALEGFDLILDSVPPNSITVDITGDLGINFDAQFNALQFAPYDPERTYKTGETCYIINHGEIEMMQMYAGPQLTCLNKDPADLTNRHEQWADPTTPFWWIPYTGTEVGTPFWWLDTTPPESAVMEINANLPTVVYWRLARRYPDLVIGDMINTGEIRGEFLRVLDQGRGVDAGRSIGTSQTHSIESHSHKINTFMVTNTGAFVVNDGSGDAVAGTDFAQPSFGWDFDKSTKLSGGSETRPRNSARAMAITI